MYVDVAREEACVMKMFNHNRGESSMKVEATTISKGLVALLVLSSMGGCATVTGGTHQSLHVETAYKGSLVSGVHCTLRNNKGSYDVTTPGSVEVHKGSLMQTVCRDARYPVGYAANVPNINGATFGNILIGGLVGTAVDAMSGASATYHDSVHVEMGRQLFWYKDDKEPIDFATDPDAVDGIGKRGAFKHALKQYKEGSSELSS